MKSPRDIGLNYGSWTEYLADRYPDVYYDYVKKYPVRVLQTLSDPQIERAMAVQVELLCYGCAALFTVDSEDDRAYEDPELIYCDACNEEARQWVERVEANW